MKNMSYKIAQFITLLVFFCIIGLMSLVLVAAFGQFGILVFYALLYTFMGELFKLAMKTTAYIVKTYLVACDKFVRAATFVKQRFNRVVGTVKGWWYRKDASIVTDVTFTEIHPIPA